MVLGLNRGEIILVAFIFGLIWVSGWLPRIAARLAGKEPVNAGDGAGASKRASPSSKAGLEKAPASAGTSDTASSRPGGATSESDEK